MNGIPEHCGKRIYLHLKETVFGIDAGSTTTKLALIDSEALCCTHFTAVTMGILRPQFGHCRNCTINFLPRP